MLNNKQWNNLLDKLSYSINQSMTPYFTPKKYYGCYDNEFKGKVVSDQGTINRLTVVRSESKTFGAEKFISQTKYINLPINIDSSESLFPSITGLGRQTPVLINRTGMPVVNSLSLGLASEPTQPVKVKMDIGAMLKELRPKILRSQDLESSDIMIKQFAICINEHTELQDLKYRLIVNDHVDDHCVMTEQILYPSVFIGKDDNDNIYLPICTSLFSKNAPLSARKIIDAANVYLELKGIWPRLYPHEDQDKGKNTNIVQGKKNNIVQGKNINIVQGKKKDKVKQPYIRIRLDYYLEPLDYVFYFCKQLTTYNYLGCNGLHFSQERYRSGSYSKFSFQFIKPVYALFMHHYLFDDLDLDSVPVDINDDSNDERDKWETLNNKNMIITIKFNDVILDTKISNKLDVKINTHLENKEEKIIMLKVHAKKHIISNHNNTYSIQFQSRALPIISKFMPLKPIAKIIVEYAESRVMESLKNKVIYSVILADGEMFDVDAHVDRIYGDISRDKNSIKPNSDAWDDKDDNKINIDRNKYNIGKDRNVHKSRDIKSRDINLLTCHATPLKFLDFSKVSEMSISPINKIKVNKDDLCMNIVWYDKLFL